MAIVGNIFSSFHLAFLLQRESFKKKVFRRISAPDFRLSELAEKNIKSYNKAIQDIAALQTIFFISTVSIGR
jgi:hypothetical protein